MDTKKFMALFAVSVMVLMSALVTIPSDDADAAPADDVVTAYLSNNNWSFTRDAEKVNYWQNENSETEFFTTEKEDVLFQEFIQGKNAEFLNHIKKTGSYTEKVWHYSLVGYNLDYDMETGEPGDQVKFYRPGPLYMQYDAGKYAFKLLTNLTNISVTGYSNNSAQLKFGEEVSVEFYGNTSVYFSTWETGYKYLLPVKVDTCGTHNVPEKSDAVTSQKISTGISWYKTDSLTIVDCYVNNSVYYFVPGSAMETKFVNEVIDGGKKDFNRSDYGMKEWGEKVTGTYNIYSNYEYFYNGSDDVELDAFREAKPYLAVYSYANSDFTICVDYDDSCYKVILTGMAYGSDSYVLSSGYKYTIHSDTAMEYRVYADGNRNNNLTQQEIDAQLDFTGLPAETGKETGLAVFGIAVFAVAFALLFLAARKPHW